MYPIYFKYYIYSRLEVYINRYSLIISFTDLYTCNYYTIIKFII